MIFDMMKNNDGKEQRFIDIFETWDARKIESDDDTMEPVMFAISIMNLITIMGTAVRTDGDDSMRKVATWLEDEGMIDLVDNAEDGNIYMVSPPALSAFTNYIEKMDEEETKASTVVGALKFAYGRYLALMREEGRTEEVNMMEAISLAVGFGEPLADLIRSMAAHAAMEALKAMLGMVVEDEEVNEDEPTEKYNNAEVPSSFIDFLNSLSFDDDDDE